MTDEVYVVLLDFKTTKSREMVTAHELPKKDTSKRITSFDYIEWIKKSRKKSA